MVNQKILTLRCYRKKYNLKKFIKFISIAILFIIIIIFPKKVFAETEEEIMDTTQEKFNISDFINEAQNYTGDFLEDVDLNNILSQAIQGKVDNKTIFQKILKLLGSEINTSLKTLISILVIIVIHGILKSITDNLENKNISINVIGNGKYIIDQYPLKNTEILYGNKLFLLTNGDEITMPDMTNWSLNDVKTYCNLIGLKFEYSGYGYVKSQSIPPNTIIDLNTMTLNIQLEEQKSNKFD